MKFGAFLKRVEVAFRLLTTGKMMRIPIYLREYDLSHSRYEGKLTGIDIAVLIALKSMDVMPIYLGLGDKFNLHFSAKVDYQKGDNPRWLEICFEEDLSEMM